VPAFVYGYEAEFFFFYVVKRALLHTPLMRQIFCRRNLKNQEEIERTANRIFVQLRYRNVVLRAKLNGGCGSNVTY